MLYKKNVEKSLKKELFKNPTSEFRGTPFWALNSYLTKEELFIITTPLVEIGSHGWEHVDANEMTVAEFASSVQKNIELLSAHPRYIPFHAYTYGGHNHKVDAKLHEKYIIPVLVDGIKNYNDSKCIHRELL